VTVRAGVRGAVDLQQGTSVPLGLTARQLEARLGTPAVGLHRKDKNYRCMFYEIVGEPPYVRLQYCFKGGRLRLLSSYVGS
jgi:hypothetical protein